MAAMVLAAPVSFAAECVLPAAEYHQINPQVLRAILHVESRMNPRAINRNANGTVDVGIAQINSIHFKELLAWGVAPQDLMNGCIGTYVAAWHLKKQMLKYGNTWFAIGAYHSATPSHNFKYQNLVYNALRKWGVAGTSGADVASVSSPETRPN